MLKNKSFIKKLNKLLISINERIESFFNALRVLKTSKKKIKIDLLNPDKKIIISVGVAIILVLTYFLMPTFYDQNLVKKSLKKQILIKYNLEVKFENNLKYSFFPKPHFYIKDTIINHKGDSLAKSDSTKIYISINNFFSLKNILIKNLFFKKTEFYINSKNFNFFDEVLNSNKSKDNIIFKNSTLFYKDINEDIIFLTNIINLKILYDDEFNHNLGANLEIFNVPLKIKVINNPEKKKAIIDLDSHNLRLNILNDFDYSKENLNGLLNFKIINKLKKINYSINNNSLDFNSLQNDINGSVDFKPFYLSSNFKFFQLDMNKLFRNNSIFLDLLKADILNNQSLNAVININFEKVKNTSYLSDLDLKVYFEEGKIYLQDSSLNWKDSVKINIENLELINENNEIIFIGTVNFEFKDINDFYSQFQIKKNYRKNINKIKLDFFLNLENNLVQFDNLQIDGSSGQVIDNYINDFNYKKLDIFNKVIFKNSIKEFFGKI